jgi:hypothetical protein
MNSPMLLTEHSEIPGTTYDECLLYGGCGGVFNEMELHEAHDTLGVKFVSFRGKFQEADAVNKNRRSYPYDILESNRQRLIEAIDNGGLCGELDHPTDSIVHFANASHKVTKLWWEGKTLMGEGAILNTPAGKVLKALINDGVRVGISSRGVGNGKVNEQGILVIGESYRLITFDAVADPSTYSAFQEKVVGTRRESVNPTNFTNIPAKNEASSIPMLNKNLLVAYMTGLIKSETNQIIERLS